MSSSIEENPGKLTLLHKKAESLGIGAGQNAMALTFNTSVKPQGEASTCVG
jgi:hypothetical protein